MKSASSCTIETSPLAILLRGPGVVEIHFQPEDVRCAPRYRWYNVGRSLWYKQMES
ncbi:hypothetical protein AGABI1DRAFT_87940 [Agaricus bisporus var. burnettii JB137-S8]|uniref:Uncharacterized protein n=1 Tax=Agaricus bisporus var. burnettii (strain JB137-S8 / ATCC MYA-4627 / FGSC 10392) TaxID=597362 RepID=K5WWV1_AGABU|nr:uncharacterized protein AGABI1DRAFT_87940 [Agaricus bisporus var. burnettii JB137-S8]EKM75283.1 hypothetical protein AGABI1DRAFT_87940 [Agaricus bisporus var. burnettii JB137-S8]